MVHFRARRPDSVRQSIAQRLAPFGAPTAADSVGRKGWLQTQSGEPPQRLTYIWSMAGAKPSSSRGSSTGGSVVGRRVSALRTALRSRRRDRVWTTLSGHPALEMPLQKTCCSLSFAQTLSGCGTLLTCKAVLLTFIHVCAFTLSPNHCYSNSEVGTGGVSTRWLC